MAKIALLVPREEMYHQAHDVLQDLHRQVFTMRVIRTENAVSEARRAIRDGAEIIIARGIQATLIKQYTDCTVVEIMLTREKVEELLFHARKVLGKEVLLPVPPAAPFPRPVSGPLRPLLPAGRCPKEAPDSGHNTS